MRKIKVNLRLTRAQVKILALYLNAYSNFLSIYFLSYRISFTCHFSKNHLIPKYHSSNFACLFLSTYIFVASRATVYHDLDSHFLLPILLPGVQFKCPIRESDYLAYLPGFCLAHEFPALGSGALVQPATTSPTAYYLL